jgi:hypothetical protein
MEDLAQELRQGPVGHVAQVEVARTLRLERQLVDTLTQDLAGETARAGPWRGIT